MKKSNIIQIAINPKFVFGALLLLFVVIACHPLHGYDEGLWSYMGNLWYTFKVTPYTGFVENKTPGILILFAFVEIFESYNVLVARAIGVLASFFTAILIYRICFKLHSKFAGAIAAFLFGLTLCWSRMDGFAFAQSETFMVFFSVLAYYFLFKFWGKQIPLKWLFLIGLSLGLAIAFKQIAITTTASLFVVFLLLYNSQTLKFKLQGLALMTSGIFMTTIISCIPLLFYNVSFTDYIEGAWLVLLNPGSKLYGASEHLNNFMSLFFGSRFIIFSVFVLLFISQKKQLSKNLWFYGLLVWLLFDFIGTNASGYYYGHQIKQLLPSLSILSAIAITHFVKQGKMLHLGLDTKKVIAILTVIMLCFPYKQFATTGYLMVKGVSEKAMPYTEVGTFIKKNTTDQDYIYVLGGDVELVQILAQSKRRSSSKYINSIFIKDELQRSVVLNDLKHKPAKYILKHKDFKESKKIYGDDFMQFLSVNYEFKKTFNSIDIYERK